MNGQDYLDQIAATARPEAPKTNNSKIAKLWSNRFFKVGLIGVAGLILIMILGMILGSGPAKPKEQSLRLILHLDNTTELISKYQPDVKSSNLRSSSASLAGVLSNTSRELTAYAEENYDYKNTRDINEKWVEQAKLEMDGLDSELFEAKINGLLDRIYAHKMAYEISAIKSEESSLYEAAGDNTLKTLLKTSYDSLENLYSKFNDFSETK